MSEADEKREEDYYASMTPYEKEREKARLRTVSDSMDKRLGRGRLVKDPPVQQNRFDPHKWVMAAFSIGMGIQSVV